jgi:sugar lactone lactonase YvrE
VVRYTPQGQVDRIVELGAKNPTCCCFGGPLLDTLYVTSADGAGLWAHHANVVGIPENQLASKLIGL